MIELNHNPRPKQLRQFGVGLMLALPVLGWLFSGRAGLSSTWEPFHTSLLAALAAGGLASGAMAWLSPRVLKPIYLAAMYAAFPIGFVVGEVILLLIYFLVFLPFAIVFRLIGRDALNRRLDRGAGSYWSPKEQPRDVRSYYRQS